MKPLAKTITYGAVHLSLSIAVAYLLTRDWRVALAIGLAVPAVQVAVHYLHAHFQGSKGGPTGDGDKSAGHHCMAL